MKTVPEDDVEMATIPPSEQEFAPDGPVPVCEGFLSNSKPPAVAEAFTDHTVSDEFVRHERRNQISCCTQKRPALIFLLEGWCLRVH